MADRRAFEPAVFLIIELPAGRADALRIAKAAGEGPRRAFLNLKMCLIRVLHGARLHLCGENNETILSRHPCRYRLDASGIRPKYTLKPARCGFGACIMQPQ